MRGYGPGPAAGFGGQRSPHALEIREMLRGHSIRTRCTKCLETIAVHRQRDISARPATYRVLVAQALKRHALTCGGEVEVLLEVAS